MPTNVEKETILDRRPRLKEACRQLQGMAEELGAEAKLPTLAELRGQLGISMQTLSDAVRELEKRHVLNSVHGVGIYVTGQKQRKITGNVGFLAPYNMRLEENITYWGSVLAGMRSSARDQGYHLLLIDNASDFMDWGKMDGAILCDMHDPRDPHPGMPQLPKNFPVVSIINRSADIACIDWDDFGGAYQLTRHLIQLGHQRIAYLANVNAGLSQLEQRKEGYIKALQVAGITVDLRFIQELRSRDEWESLPTWYYQAGKYYMERWLEEDWADLCCTALVAQNDAAARGAIHAFRSAGINTPRDVSVVGYDGLDTESGISQLTTIRVPLFEVGERAMQSLLGWLEDPLHPPGSVCLPVEFVQGQTTASPSSIVRKSELVAV